MAIESVFSGYEKTSLIIILQTPVVQTMDSAVHRINHYPADKH